jgi:hypothetical protein
VDVDAKIEDTFPEIFTIADSKALAEQRRYFRLSLTGLLAAVIAAVGSAIEAGFTVGGRDIDGGGVISALAFLAGVGVAGYVLVSKPERIWYESRAAAESIKTLAWQYCVRGGSFDHDTATDALQFGRRVRRIVRGLRHAGLPTIGGSDVVTGAMSAFRARPLADRRAIYLNQRILDQNRYYARKAVENRGRAQSWFLTAIVLQAAGVVLAVLKALDVVGPDLLGIAATAAASALAWVQTKDSQALAESYVIAANELAAILGEAEAHPKDLSEVDWSAFVRSGEQAVSREHTLWLARRDPGLTPDE